MSKSLKPTNLKILLGTILVLVIAATVFIFITQGGTSNDSQTTTPTSVHTDQELNELKTYVENNKTSLATIDKLIPSSATAQAEISNAIDKAASTAGIAITKKAFEKSINISEMKQIPNLTADYVAISFSGSIKYSNFIVFLKSIENSTPKMQVLNLNITPNDSGDQITITPITIGFYKR